MKRKKRGGGRGFYSAYKKRFFCVLVAAVMILGMVPTAFAEQTGSTSSQTGTSSITRQTDRAAQSAGSSSSSQRKVLKARADDEGEPVTMAEFEKTMDFCYYLNDEDHGLVDSARSGTQQTINLFCKYVHGDNPINTENMYMELTFPKGITPSYPDASETAGAAAFSERAGENGSTIVKLKWNNVTPASGKQTYMYFSCENGTLDKTKFEIPVKVYYEGEESTKFSNRLVYTAIADQFAWQIGRNPSGNAVKTLQNKNTGPVNGLNVTYNLTPQNFNTGKANTGEISFTENFTVSDQVRFKEENLTGTSESISFSNVVKDHGGYVKSFTVNFLKKNTAPDKELDAISAGFSINGATVVPKDPDKSETITNALTSVRDSFKGKIKSVSSSNPAKDLTLAGYSSYSVQYNVPTITPENPKKSATISLGRVSVNGAADANRVGVYAGDQVGYKMYSFKNQQESAMASYTLTQTVDPDMLMPVKIQPGLYTSYGTLSTYKINFYNESGARIGSKVINFADTRNTAFSIQDCLTSGHKMDEVAKLEWEFGPVPAGFSPKTVPITYVNVLHQDVEGSGNGSPITINGSVAYKYKGLDVSANASALSYSYKQPNLDSDYEFRNKAMKNLTNPGSKEPAAGDLLEYTVTVKNQYGVDLVNPEIEDYATNQTLYTREDIDGYSKLLGRKGNVRLVSPVYEKDGDLQYSNVTAAKMTTDPSKTCNLFKMTGTFKAGDEIRLSYVMKVDDGVSKPAKITNAFDCYGYLAHGGSGGGSGSGDSRVHIGSGSGVTDWFSCPVPHVSAEYKINEKAGAPAHSTATPAGKGQQLQLTYTITNEDYLKESGLTSGKVHIGSFATSIWNNSSTAAFVPVGKGSLKVGSKTYKDIAFDTDVNIAGKAGYDAPTNFKFNLTSVSGIGAKGLELNPGESATLTFYVEANRHAQNMILNTNYEKIHVDHYTFFMEPRKEIKYKKAENVYDNTSSDAKEPGLDKISDTKSYHTAAGEVYLKRDESVKYAAISSFVSSKISALNGDGSVALLDGDTERTYQVYLRNYSSAGKTIEVEKLMTRIPLCEKVVPDSVSLTYKEGAKEKKLPVSDSGVTERKVLDGRRIMEFGGLPGNEDAKGKVAVDGSAAGTNYILLTFKTKIADGDLDRAMEKMTETGNGTSWKDTGFQPAFYIKDDTWTSPSSGQKMDVIKDSDDWDGDKTTDSFYSGNHLWSENRLSIIRPGTAIAPMEIIRTSGGKITYRSVSDGFCFKPGDSVGFHITAANQTGTGNAVRTMVDPKIAVVLPVGIKYEKLEVPIGPVTYDSSYIREADGKQVVIFNTKADINLQNPLEFNIKTSSNNVQGRLNAEVFVVPMGTCERFCDVASHINGVEKVSREELKAATKIIRPAAVKNQCEIKIFGDFAFSSHIQVTDNKDKTNKAPGGGKIEVKRDENDFNYDLTFKNESNSKIYENFVLIDRTPGRNDIYNLDSAKRASTENVVMTSVPTISIDGKLLTPGTDYKIQYTSDSRDKQYDKDKEYKPQGAPKVNWSDSMDLKDATAFRVLFGDTNIDVGAEIVVNYNAKFEGNTYALPLKGVIAYNSFAFGFNAKGSKLFNVAEPRKVAVVMEDLEEETVTSSGSTRHDPSSESSEESSAPTKHDPSDDSGRHSGAGTNENGTKTGDDSNMALYIMLAVFAAAGVAFAMCPSLRRRWQNKK